MALGSIGENRELDLQLEHILNNVAKSHKQIILILDNRVIEAKKSQLDELFSGIFGTGNYAFA